jgi:hypothetical protein
MFVHAVDVMLWCGSTITMESFGSFASSAIGGMSEMIGR